MACFYADRNGGHTSHRVNTKYRSPPPKKLQQMFHGFFFTRQHALCNCCAKQLYEVMLILRCKDVDIDANSILFLLFDVPKSILNEPGFSNSSWRNKHSIAPILKIFNQFLGFFCAVTKIIWTHITLINKGVFDIYLCHNYLFNAFLILRKIRNGISVTDFPLCKDTIFFNNLQLFPQKKFCLNLSLIQPVWFKCR